MRKGHVQWHALRFNGHNFILAASWIGTGAPLARFHWVWAAIDYMKRHEENRKGGRRIQTVKCVWGGRQFGLVAGSI